MKSLFKSLRSVYNLSDYVRKWIVLVELKSWLVSRQCFESRITKMLYLSNNLWYHEVQYRAVISYTQGLNIQNENVLSNTSVHQGNNTQHFLQIIPLELLKEISIISYISCSPEFTSLCSTLLTMLPA